MACPVDLYPPIRPLPFLYVSNGKVTDFLSRLDPDPRSRRIFAPHRPETLAEWLAAEPHTESTGSSIQRKRHGVSRAAETRAAEHTRSWDWPSTLRSRLRRIPTISTDPGHADAIPGMWPNQLRAIHGLERSLAGDKPRALIQMATGSGKSLTAVVSIYRLLEHAQARRVLFLVDRTNLGEQAADEFGTYRTYDTGRKFTELFNVQRLESNHIRRSSRVVITTIQRLYSMLRGEPEFDATDEQGSLFEHGTERPRVISEVAYNPAIPPEFFDIIFIDECHRSIYSLWRRVFGYFDAHLIGLTATPAAHTFGFFYKNLVMEYNHERAVADGVNVGFDIYEINTRITKQGATIEAQPGVLLEMRDRATRDQRWEQPDEDISYTAKQLDRDVVAKDQIRLIIRTFKERLFTEIFPDRTTVPKTLIFAKGDSHADDIVDIVK